MISNPFQFQTNQSMAARISRTTDSITITSYKRPGVSHHRQLRYFQTWFRPLSNKKKTFKAPRYWPFLGLPIGVSHQKGTMMRKNVHVMRSSCISLISLAHHAVVGVFGYIIIVRCLEAAWIWPPCLTKSRPPDISWMKMIPVCVRRPFGIWVPVANEKYNVYV